MVQNCLNKNLGACGLDISECKYNHSSFHQKYIYRLQCKEITKIQATEQKGIFPGVTIQVIRIPVTPLMQSDARRFF
jgi:hypothetical protein